MNANPITILCVDDNQLVADALKQRLRRHKDLKWAGHLTVTAGLAETVRAQRADVILLDIDISGPDPFEMLPQITTARPESRVIMFSGHVRSDLVDRAIDAGAWGYLSKDVDFDEIVKGIRCVMAGQFALGPDVTPAVPARGAPRRAPPRNS